MIATRSVERGRSALHKSSQLHSRLLNPPASPALRNNTNISWHRPCRVFQRRLAHTRVPFGWTTAHENEEPQAPPPPPPDDRVFWRPPSEPQERFRLARRPTSGSVLGSGPLLPTSGRPGTVPYYHAALKALLSALRQRDTFKLYLCLRRLVVGHDTESGSRAFKEVMATIPSTTFSEILRSFDPHRVAEAIDTAPGLNISYGLAIRTPLGELVNQWGIKTLYVRILRRLLHIQLARREAGLIPLMNDYIVLMRCAGAISNIRIAKDLWYSMSGDRLGRADIRHSEAYSEFIKARYLAEKIYANNDLSRFRLRPLDMHRSSIMLKKKVLLRLKYLVANIRNHRRHRFGYNMHERFFDEPLTKVLRKRDPLTKLESTMALRGYENNNEETVCALLKVNGRTGRKKSNRYLLMRNWGVRIEQDKETGAISIEGGHTYPPDSPRKPTAALLDAVVHSYCSMGEVTMAVRLLDYISQRFSIPVPDHVWSDLIEYTRIMQSKPAATEWAIAEFSQKGSTADQVLEVWNLCTQAPYSFQPGARDYHNLIKSLVRRRRPMLQPIEALRQVKPLYDNTVNECEQAWCELVQTTQQAVPNHNAFHRYKLLQAKRDHMWFNFNYSIYLILKGMHPGHINDESAVRGIPKLIGDFAQFMPSKVSYRIATGLVEFHTGARRRKNIVDVAQTSSKPLFAPETEVAAEEGEDGHSVRERAFELASRAPTFYDQLIAGQPPESRSNAQEVEKPAYMYRPRFSGPSDEQTILSIRRDGGEFTGYHNDPLRQHFAAYRQWRVTRRQSGVPVDLEWSAGGKGGQAKRHSKMVDEVMRIRT